jgi:hypothetical protein
MSCCGGINPWGKERKAVRPVKPWDLLKKENWTEAEVYAKRLEICEACDNFTKTRQCSLCHCFMDMKTRLENAYCPIRKW